MSIPPLVFTGISNFSNDFQTILSRAQQIAQIPVQQLQNKDADVLQRRTLLGGLSTATAALATSLRNLGTVAANHALSATSSDTTKVSATNSGATQATTYTIDSITSPATVASERTLTGCADAATTPVSRGPSWSSRTLACDGRVRYHPERTDRDQQGPDRGRT